MSKFQVNKLKVDLMETSVENLFLDTYLPLANEIQLKVYLYGLKLAQGEKEVDDEELSKFLNVDINDIDSAWGFWKDLGIVDIREDKGEKIYIFKSIRSLYLGLDSEYESNIDIIDNNDDSKEDMIEDSFESFSSSNTKKEDGVFTVSPDAMNMMYKAIEDYISMDQPVYISLDPKDIRILNDLVYDFELDPFFVSYAYHLASEINDFKSKNPPYVTKVIERWVKYENIRSIDELDRYIEKRSKAKEEAKEKNKANVNKKKANKPKNVYGDERLSKAERRALIQKKLRDSRK